MNHLFMRRRSGWLLLLFLAILTRAAPASALGNEECEVAGCGANTPILFGTPIVGLSLNGVTNRNGVILDRRLERVVAGPGACPDGALLSVDHGELIGVTATGTCRGKNLIGMAFALQIPEVPCVESGAQGLPNACGPAPRRSRVRVRFGEVSDLPTWTVPPQNLPTYQLIWHELPPSGPMGPLEARAGDSVCPMRVAWMESWQSTTPPSGSFPGFHFERWSAQTDHLLAVQGETYNPDATVDQGRRGDQWFNLACVGTAIAKMRLLGYDPLPQPAAWTGRQATLKMLTGRYAGTTSYTSAGMPLQYVRWDGATFSGQPKGAVNVATVESYWNAGGAMCLSHRRTWKPHNLLLGQDPLTALSSWLAAARPEGGPISGVLLPEDPDVLALYESAEQASVDGVGPAACGAPPPSYIWLTRPVAHVAH